MFDWYVEGYVWFLWYVEELEKGFLVVCVKN